MKLSRVFGLVFTFCLFFSSAVNAGNTDYKKIDEVRVSGEVGQYYFTSVSGKWGAPGCPNAKYAYIQTDEHVDPHAMLSLALAAKMSDRPVLFSGVCEGASYFKVSKIRLK